MPQLILDGVALVPAPRPVAPKPHIHDHVDLADYAETTWVYAQLDAWDAQDRARQALEYETRLQRGEAWLRLNGVDHPRYREAKVRVLNLYDRVQSELLAVRCYERQCWLRINECFGFRVNGNLPTSTPEQMWAELMGERAIPEVKRINGCIAIEPMKAGVATWQLLELRELLAKKVARMNPERIAIVGSRPPKNDPDWEHRVWPLVHAQVFALPETAVIVSGGAQGVDQLAAAAAHWRKMQVIEHLPDWDTHGKAAGAKRNQQIVDDADRVIAFWDGQSRGTKITIDMARRAGKPVEIVDVAAHEAGERRQAG